MGKSVIIEQNKRVLWIDILNILACIGVVFLHCAMPCFTGQITLHWLWTEFVHVAILWPVPVFFMISGCNLLSPRAGEGG